MENTKVELRQSIGFWTATSIVIGIAIGSGIYVKPGLVLNQTGSTMMALAAWLLGGVMAITAGLTIAEVASRIPKTGGIYAYIHEIYGKKLGFLAGWVMTFLYGPGLSGALALYFSSLLQPFLGYEDNLIPLIAIISMSFLIMMNTLGTKFGGYIQTLTTVGKLIPVILIIAFGLFNGAEPLVAIANVDPVKLSFGSAVLSTLWAYDGWILVGNVAGEMSNAKRILPLAIISGLLIVTVAYLGMNISLFHVLPTDTILNQGVLAANTAGESLFGVWGGKLIGIGVLVSIFGCLNGAILSGPRIAYAMTEKGNLKYSNFIGYIHRRFRTPINAILLQGGIATVMIVLAKPDQITDFAMFSVYIFYVLAFLGLFLLRGRSQGKSFSFREIFITPILKFRMTRDEKLVLKSSYDGYLTPLFPWVPLIAIVSSLYILGNTVLVQTEIALVSCGLTALGLVAYSFLKKE